MWSTVLLTLWAVFVAGCTLVQIRLEWYHKQRCEWIDWVHEYNMIMFQLAATNNPWSIPQVINFNLENFGALGPWGHGLWDFRIWRLEGLVVDRDRYLAISKFYEDRRAHMH